MTTYLLQVALIIGGCLAFYKIFLQKETFYRINRYVLIGCLLAAFSLPFVRVPEQLSFRKVEVVKVVPEVPAPIALQEKPSASNTGSQQQPVNNQETTITQTSSFNADVLMKWAIYLYWIGVGVFGINLLVQIVVLLYRAYRNPVIIDGYYRIVEVTGDMAPCSFGNNIFINPEKYEWETYNQILQHEKIHVRQKHSMDLLLAEIALIFQWFNPFAWLYRKEIENNLEFLTDSQMVEKESVEVQQYQFSLLKVSTPQLPLKLTTNYNQSLLKKRIAMMNAKKSNLHTAWKYLFLVPMLVLLVSLLNEPVAKAQSSSSQPNASHDEKQSASPQQQAPTTKKEMDLEGSWFATIKGEKIELQFKSDDDEHGSFNTSSFQLSEVTGSLPKGSAGTFKIVREAGTMDLNGKFEGDQGMGKYKFIPNKEYGAAMKNEINESLSDRDLLVFFFINVKKSYVAMLKSQGYKGFGKDDLIPLVALNIDQAYISSMKESGLKDLSLHDLIPLKSLKIDKAYIQEIRASGYKDVDADKLISLKAQGIDGEYIKKMQKASGKEGDISEKEASDLVAFKSLKIDDEYVNSFKSVGYTNVDRGELIALKSLNVTPEYIKGFQEIGYKNTKISEFIGLKSQNVTPEYVKSFEALGYKEEKLDEFIALKALNITAEYVKEMKAKGFDYSKLNKYITLKSLH